MSSNLTVESYSEKAIAVFGDTKQIKDHLLALQGKFNPSLRGNGDEKRAGWIFPKTKLEDVKKIVEGFKNGTIKASESSSESGSSSSFSSSTYKKKSETKSENEFSITKEMYLSILSRLEKAEQELALSRVIIDKLTSQNNINLSTVKKEIPKQNVKVVFDEGSDDEVSESEEEEEVKAPPKRLLSKRN